MKVVYSARYHIDIGPHVFPARKYLLVYARLVEAGVIRTSDVVEPAPASWEDLSRVHTAEYLAKMRDGTLSADGYARHLEDTMAIHVDTVQEAKLAATKARKHEEE